MLDHLHADAGKVVRPSEGDDRCGKRALHVVREIDIDVVDGQTRACGRGTRDAPP